MPDEDIQTIYINERTREEEWRCRYCPQVYQSSGSTSGPSGHLVTVHHFEKGDGRDAKTQQIQHSMEQAFIITAVNPQKRRRIDPKTIN